MKPLKGLASVAAWQVYQRVIYQLRYCDAHRLPSNRLSATLAELMLCDDLDSFKRVQEGVDAAITAGSAKPFDLSEALIDFKCLPDTDKKVMLLECIHNMPGGMTNEDMLRLVRFHEDANGMSISPANVGNYGAEQLTTWILDTLIACSYTQLDLFLLSPEQKTMLDGKCVDIGDALTDAISNNIDGELEDIHAMATKQAMNKFTQADTNG